MIKPDYHWIKIDETLYWKPEFVSSIGEDASIISTYVFDINSRINCCELTPSYELHFAGTEFRTSRKITDEEWEEIDGKIRAANALDDCSVKYLHCNDVRGNQPITQFIDCDNDVTIEEVIEYYQANPW